MNIQFKNETGAKIWFIHRQFNSLRKEQKSHKKPHNNLSYHATKLILNKIFKKQINEKFKLESSNKPWLSLLEKSAVPEAPRYEAVAIFRLLSGHDCLAAHLYEICIYPSPICVLCNEANSRMDKDNLINCKALNHPNSTSKLYWEARRRMETIQVLGQ